MELALPPLGTLRCFTALAAVLGIGLAVPLRAQEAPPDSARQAIVTELLSAMRAVDVAMAAMEAQLPAQRALSPKVTPAFWERFVERLRSDSTGFLATLAPIYERSFTAQELNDILSFYRSPTGRRFVELQPELAQASVRAAQRWGARIGAEVAAELIEEGIPISTE